MPLQPKSEGEQKSEHEEMSYSVLGEQFFGKVGATDICASMHREHRYRDGSRINWMHKGVQMCCCMVDVLFCANLII